MFRIEIYSWFFIDCFWNHIF